MNETEKIANVAKDFPIGTHVRYFSILGRPEFEPAVVRSEPWALGHGAIVVSITGRAGGVPP